MQKQDISGAQAKAYWRANLQLVSLLLVIWFFASFGAGILFADGLNRIEVGGFKLGFWFAQQGAIYVFVLLIFVYIGAMRRLDRKFGVSDDAEPDSYDLIDQNGNR